MNLVRRDILQFAAAVVAASAASPAVWGQSPAGGPKAQQVMRRDLEGQGQVVQETVVTVVEFPPGSTAPWHNHPGAQEILYGLEGALTVEVEGRGLMPVKAGDIGLVSADVSHTVRNESSNVIAKALVIHSRSDKDKPLRVDVKKG
jgi:quercetin dioxygenase-like cupin family protein